MTIAFLLSMPSNNSWDGKWSGDGELFARIRTFRGTKKNLAKIKTLTETGKFYYHWTDGWTACVEVKKVDRGEAQKMKKKTKGFCGYDWMIDSIVMYGKIIIESERKDAKPL